ncbi:MAG: ribosome maturation factor RimM [Bacteroidia bacterium]
MQLQPVGYFSRTHGLKGHLVLQASCELDISGIRAVFIEAGGSQAPYFTEEIKEFSGGFLLKLEGIDTVETAAKLKNKTVLAEAKHIAEEAAFEFLNYKLVDEVKGEVGLIEDLVGTPGNPLLKVNRAGQEVLLPFNADFIVKVRKKEKQLLYHSPEGLLDLYL